MKKRATARFGDKQRADRKRIPKTDGWKSRLALSEAEFVAWYTAQRDCCHYCGTTFDELRRLRLRRPFGYYVSWDIDRKDSLRPYELGNLALSCFMCNMAKGSYFSAAEAQVVGQAIRQVVLARLRLADAA